MKDTIGFIFLFVLLNLPFDSVFSQEVVKYDRETWNHRQSREEFARIFSGETDKAIANMTAYLRKHSDDPESLFGLSVAYYSKNDEANGELYFIKALDSGIPIERFMAGPREELAPLYKTKIFRKLTRDKVILHGPLTGAVSCNLAKVWIRTFNEKTFKVTVANDSLMMDVVGTFTGNTHERDDFTGIALLTGLKPGTRYYYSINIDGYTPSDIATFTTFNNDGQPGVLKVAFGGGAAYNPSKEHIWSVIKNQNPDFFIGMGDNVYIDHPELPDVQRYCYYRRESSPFFRKMLQSLPYYSVWDDHEFGKNDSYGGADKFLPEWKTSVLKVFKENSLNPSYAGGESQPGTWYNFSAGDVDFFMLDTRYYRIPSFANDTTENVNMLGQEQMEWLKEKLRESEADFKVIVSSVPWSDGAKDVMAGRFDTWRGYKTERQEIFNFLSQNHINGVILLSADRHRHDVWKHERGDDYPLYEFTSSNLTNIHYHELRKGALFGYNEKSGFGVLEFNTNAKQPYVVFKIVNIDNELIDQLRIYLHQLK